MQLHKFLQSPFEAIGHSPIMLGKKLPNLAYKTLNPFFASPVKYRSCRYCHFQESGQKVRPVTVQFLKLNARQKQTP